MDRAARTVTTAAGEVLAWDKLVLATGSYPFVPPVPGNQRADCFVYRTIEDLGRCANAARVRAAASWSAAACWASNAPRLRDMGLETHVVEFAPRLMAVQVDEGGGSMLQRKIEELGVQVHTRKSTLEIVDGEDCRHRMVFADGSTLEADMIVFSAGIRPRDELARATGLELGPRGGVAIDSSCRSSDPDIYAIGECAVWNGQTFGLVAPGYDMARVAARHLAGQDDVAFAGADLSTKLKLMGGTWPASATRMAAPPGCRSYQYADERRQLYKRLVTSADGKRLLGAVLVGDASEYGMLLQMALNGIELPQDPEFLILPSSDGKAKPTLGVEALADGAQICSCNNVSKGQICSAVREGAITVAQLKAGCKAGATCGGCVPLVTQVMKSEMAQLGLAVDNHVCEHFPIRARSSITSCGSAASAASRSCWPGTARAWAARSASRWRRISSLLAGTSSCSGTSRRPAGQQRLLPRQHPEGRQLFGRAAHARRGGHADGLIAVGRIAKKYGLYTKITGGQRVDMFGARVEQLPPIWEEPIAEGFESGHAWQVAAHGQELRGRPGAATGSMTASAWRSSSSTAIRAARTAQDPFGVSGCTRECAEAQGKDVGVIATDKGWNSMSAGNGGMKPRHAELLAADLSKDELLRLIDRSLMFYMRTADRLQRTKAAGARAWKAASTSPWRDVLVADSLGIGAEPRVADEPRHRHLPVRVEDCGHPARGAPALPHLRQQRPARRAHRVQSRNAARSVRHGRRSAQSVAPSAAKA